MKTYKLIGRNNHPDISFTVEDLLPIKPQKQYTCAELIRLIDYSNYKHAGENFEDYITLYAKEKNKNIDFFKIRGTDIIVIPGNYIYPTILKEKDI